MCAVFVKDELKARVMCAVFTSAIMLWLLWFAFRQIIVVLACAVILLVLIAVLIFKTKEKLDGIDSLDYLVEDVVAKFKKRFRSGSGYAGHDHIYTFSEYGKYKIHKSIYYTVNIPIFKKKHIDRAAADRTAVESCE